ncbi:MAG: hypothetical protein LBQ12_08505 [Deltaproteobacteria bacterium]|jgi:hypothetical protein|nr:hypothetical protein [Deltaproteobacteria bacterium]
MKDAIRFLTTVLPEPGPDVRYFCWSPGMQEAFRSPEALAERAFKLSDEGRDAYMALAGFDLSGSRRQEHAVSVRSLWLDIDCGKDSGPSYPDKPAALAGLAAFVAKLELPKPLVVDSGHGLHVYWPFTRDVTPTEWRELAVNLKGACLAHGLKADHHRTTDVASVLRMPGTMNYKRRTPQSVEEWMLDPEVSYDMAELPT